MTFKIGMKVVCVDDGGLCADEVHKGEVFTVEEIIWSGNGLLVSPLRRSGRYFARRFRPAVSPKQQVSFTTGAPQDSRKWDCRRKRVEVVS